MNIEQSNLMLSDEEICSKILHCGKSNIETCRKLEQRCNYLYDIKSSIRAELDHLKGLGIVFIRERQYCPACDGKGYYIRQSADGDPIQIGCGECFLQGYIEVDIPLSDYKGEL